MPNYNFLFSKLEFSLFLWHFAKAVGASNLPHMKNAWNQKVLGLGPLQLCFYAESQNSCFWFLALGPLAPTRAVRRVHPSTKLPKITKYPQPIWVGAPFIKKVQISKFLLPGWPAWPFGPFFSGHGPEIQNSVPNIFASLSWFQKGMTQPPDFKTLEGDRFGRNPFFGVRALPRGL